MEPVISHTQAVEAAVDRRAVLVGTRFRSAAEPFSRLTPNLARVRRGPPFNGGTTTLRQDPPQGNPSSADRLLQEVMEESKRKREISEFIAKVHRRALRFASRFLVRNEACEDAVASAYIKLATGKTTEKYFMRALKHTCLDMKKRMRLEARIFESAEAPRLRNGLVSSHPGAVANDLDSLLSPLSEDQDPLEILSRREEYEALQTQLRAAMKDPRWRFMKRKKWAQALLPLPGRCAEMNPSIAF